MAKHLVTLDASTFALAGAGWVKVMKANEDSGPG
jgi:hypothetical protein